MLRATNDECSVRNICLQRLVRPRPGDKPFISIGRHVNSDVLLHHNTQNLLISRRHAEITLKSRSFQLEDLGSVNGTNNCILRTGSIEQVAGWKYFGVCAPGTKSSMINGL